MSEQTKASQAENAVKSVQHAVDQAQSHPSSNKIEEADHALRHSQAAVRQAEESNSPNDDELAQRMDEEREALGQVTE